MATFDFKKDRKDLYAPPTTGFVLVDVPPMTFLAIDGHGDPNTSVAYREAVEALYAASYAVKFAGKAQGRDIVVGPLEGLWSAADPGAFTSRAKADWDWTMMIRQPDWATADMLRETIAATARKKSLPALEAMRVFPYAEGTCLQIMYIGAYDGEAPTLARLHDEIMPAQGLTWNGPHHEIYLGDPRRVAPEKLKTILRQPVRPANPEPAGVA